MSPFRKKRLISMPSRPQIPFHSRYPPILRERSCQDQGIDNRDHGQNREMKQMHLHGKIPVVGKRSERVDGGMHKNAWDQASAAIKDRDQQKTDRNGKDDLAQIADQIHAASVEQVDDMPDTKSHTGDNNGGFDIILCNGLKQKPPEDYFLQETNT